MTAHRIFNEALEKQAAAEVAEPLLRGLPPGRHWFGPAEYQALAWYLLGYVDEDRALHRALSSDSFSVSAIEFCCARDFDSEKWISVSEFARRTGSERRTLAKRCSNAHLRGVTRGKQVLYDVADLNRLLEPKARVRVRAARLNASTEDGPTDAP